MSPCVIFTPQIINMTHFSKYQRYQVAWCALKLEAQPKVWFDRDSIDNSKNDIISDEKNRVYFLKARGRCPDWASGNAEMKEFEKEKEKE